MAGVVEKPRRRGPSDELLCGCANLSRDAFIAEVARRPTASFDTLLDVTGSGRECTACMLDLEYLFTESPRDAAVWAECPGRCTEESRGSSSSLVAGRLRLLPIVHPESPPLWSHSCVALHSCGVERFAP